MQPVLASSSSGKWLSRARIASLRVGEAEFLRVFSQRENPRDIPTFVLRQPMSVVELLTAASLARSKSEARRLVRQGGVRLNDQRIDDIHTQVAPPGGEMVLRVGRRRFLRLVGAPTACTSFF